MDTPEAQAPKKTRPIREGFCSGCGHLAKIPYRNGTCVNCYHKNKPPKAEPRPEARLTPKDNPAEECEIESHAKKRINGIIVCITCKLMKMLHGKKPAPARQVDSQPPPT